MADQQVKAQIKAQSDFSNILKIIGQLLPLIKSIFKKTGKKKKRKFLNALNEGDTEQMNKMLSKLIGYHIVERLPDGNYVVRRGFVWEYYLLKLMLDKYTIGIDDD